MLPEAMPFPGATGKGLKIVVIDSGVNVQHVHIISKTAGMVLGNDESDVWSDSLGHGTAVMAAIQEKAPEAEYLAIKLFDQSLAATSSRLLQAISVAIDSGANLINLSLGTSNSSARPEFESVVRRANEAGAILVCARYANERPMLPGVLEGVISVDVDWRLTRHAYRPINSQSDIYYAASGFPRPLPGVPPSHNLKGISFAVANMTGLVARACNQFQKPSLPDVNHALASAALALQA